METGCVIALSSDWRFKHDPIILGKELDLPIIFSTPNLVDKYRAEEIQELIDQVKPEKYALIDDQEQDNEFKGMNFVKVNGEDGVSFDNYLQLIEFLK